MKIPKFLLSILLIACLVMAIGLPAYAAKVIKIGVIGPMKFVQGKGHWNGATMAADEINAKGGIQVGSKKMKNDIAFFRIQESDIEELSM